MTITATDTIAVMADAKSMKMFRLIFELDGDTKELYEELKFTKKAFYTRLHRLLTLSLIERKAGRYHVSSYGKVILESYKKLDAVFGDFYKLKAIDSIDMTKIPLPEQTQIIERMISNKSIRSILYSRV